MQNFCASHVIYKQEKEDSDSSTPITSCRLPRSRRSQENYLEDPRQGDYELNAKLQIVVEEKMPLPCKNGP
jgi:hypothetical protein